MAAELAEIPHGRSIQFAGLVRFRQLPETADGVTFLTLEDEDGMVNALVWQQVTERQRRILLAAQLLHINARLERVDGVQHLIVNRMTDFTGLLSGIEARSRDFH